MITEDYVSFETAKLLKEKGFTANIHGMYDHDGKFCESTFTDVEPYYSCYAPTLQMAMKWLRKVYNIHFSIEPYTIFPENINCKVFYSVEIQQLVTDNEGILYKGELEIKHYIDDIESYEEACEAAIKYCLENLI